MKNILLLLFLIISLSGFSQNNSFAFLKVGNEWKYVLTSEEGDEESVIFRILDKKKDHFIVEQVWGKEKQETVWYVDGEYLREFSKGSDPSGSWIIMKTNPHIGDTWSSNLGFERISFEIVATDQHVETKAGVFDNAYKVIIRYSNGALMYTTYFSQDIGPLSAFNKGELVSINF